MLNIIPLGLKVATSILTVLGVPVMLLFGKIYADGAEKKASVFYRTLAVAVSGCAILFWML